MFKLAEALDWLQQQTGRPWSDSELFDICCRRTIPLHAAPPLEAKAIVLETVPGNACSVAFNLGWRQAILWPIRIGQLWHAGEAEPIPAWTQEDRGDGVHRWAVFDPAVRVRREHLSIKRETLERVLHAWRNPSPVERLWRARDASPEADLPEPATEFEQLATPAAVDLASLATPAELLDAFPQWLKAEWFDNLSDRKWLRTARRHKGKSGRSGTAPLFCPFAVMRGLMTSTRGERLPQVRGWFILREKFPAAHATHEHERPGAQSVGNE